MKIAMSEKKESGARLSVVVPVYNEEATLREVVGKVLAVPNLLEVVVVDDGSTDRTHEVALSVAESNPRVRVERLGSNSGKTAALRAGFALTRGEVVIVQDADLEYDPSEIPTVVGPTLVGYADCGVGSRFLV